jgi:lipopolysaccharide/colanic/teichoic acid biosynthesis glycosyltransferase
MNTTTTSRAAEVDTVRGSAASLPRRTVKRAFDIVVSSLMLLLLSPVFLVIAVAIKLDSRGPVFFRQVRVGLGGRPFKIFKFRSMIEDQPSDAPNISPRHDPRITRVGAFLRRSFLDELPQLLNVIGGQMSMVGPRPETPNYIAYYTRDELRVLSMKPGMAGPSTLGCSVDEPKVLAGVADADRYYVEVLLHQRLELDLAYAGWSSLSGATGTWKMVDTSGEPTTRRLDDRS